MKTIALFRNFPMKHNACEARISTGPILQRCLIAALQVFGLLCCAKCNVNHLSEIRNKVGGWLPNPRNFYKCQAEWYMIALGMSGAIRDTAKKELQSPELESSPRYNFHNSLCFILARICIECLQYKTTAVRMPHRSLSRRPRGRSMRFSTKSGVTYYLTTM